MDFKNISYLDGLMLGDGGVYWNSSGKKTAFFQQTCKYEEYLVYLLSRLQDLDLDFTENYIPPKKHIRNRPGKKATVEYVIRSRGSLFLSYYRKRWYPNGKKIVPEDVEITGESLGPWYLGDGSLVTHKEYVKGIKFCALAFSNAERNFLGKKLINLGLSISVYNNRGEIFVNKSSLPKFFELIGETPVPCFEYKWGIGKMNNVSPNVLKIRKMEEKISQLERENEILIEENRLLKSKL